MVNRRQQKKGCRYRHRMHFKASNSQRIRREREKKFSEENREIDNER